jgi:carbon monoxide dehydrogenase subunit G
MELEHSFTIPVPPEQAWQVLLDVEQVAPCMPGATIDSVDGDEIKGRIKVKVGPVALTYAGTAHFVERDEQARSVTLEASGKETRGSGTASATVRSSLRDEGRQTRVVVHTTMNVTGRPAQFGRGVMAEVGGRLVERFATNLAAQLAGGGQSGAADQSGAGGQSAASAEPAESLAASNGAGPGTSVPGPVSADGSASIEDLNLPVRAYNSLRRDGIHTVSDLSALSEEQLLAIDNIGPRSVAEIRQKLAERGFALGASGAAARRAPDETPVPDEASPSAAVAGAAHAAGTGAGTGSAGTGGAAGSDGASAAGRTAAAASAATGATVREPAPLRARPPDEDAIDLLSVAGFPVLKRALPVAAAVAALLLLFLRVRGRRRSSKG